MQKVALSHQCERLTGALYLMFNAGMTDDAKLISSLGGPTKVALLLGYKKGGVQRVFNWISRGIPPRVKLERPDLFLSGKRRLKRTRSTEELDAR